MAEPGSELESRSFSLSSQVIFQGGFEIVGYVHHHADALGFFHYGVGEGVVQAASEGG